MSASEAVVIHRCDRSGYLDRGSRRERNLDGGLARRRIRLESCISPVDHWNERLG